MRRRTLPSRRGATLIEVMVIVIALGLAVPPALQLLDSAAASRADSVNATRAALLATSVMETVIADVDSDDPGLGFDALADDATYLAGLATRAAPVTDAYAGLKLTYQVTIGPLSQADGTVSGDADLDVYRRITVTARYPSATGGTVSMPVHAIVTDLTP
ncbi:MAG: hypothetical protein R3B57_10745 [Phycisphaerales bacterium]